MPLRSDWSASQCPIARSLEVVGDPWVLLILRDALLGSRRFEQFRAKLGIADNVLSRRLAAMVEAGLLRRVPYRGERRTHHEYQVTEAGAELLPVLNALAAWGNRHTGAGAEAMDTVHLPCGQVTTSADTCSHCGRPLHAGEVAWRRPWRSPADAPLAPAG